MKEKLQPALFGGLLTGLLSAIPIVSAANICCCLWGVVGGLLAGYLYIKKSPLPVKTGESAQVGLFAGVIGGLIYILIGLPLSLIFRQSVNEMMISFASRLDPLQAAAIRQQVESQSFGEALVLTTLIMLLGAILLAAFCTVGSLIAVPLFEKHRPD
ncbi:MAG: hypothetical protein C4334_11505 [Pyrinomonas sp.]|uniref:hypothetical protein n=1 Tax=Pyrinomonas sp. TaxID=2080306 RepID=UPI00331E19C2